MGPFFEPKPVLETLDDLVDSLLGDQSSKSDDLSEYFKARDSVVEQVFQAFCLFEDDAPIGIESSKAETLLLALGNATWCQAATSYCLQIGFEKTIDILSIAIKSQEKRSRAQIGTDCFIALFQHYNLEQQTELFKTLVSSHVYKKSTVSQLTIASQLGVVRNKQIESCLDSLFKRGNELTKEIASQALSIFLERSTNFEDIPLEHWKENIDQLYQVIFSPSSSGRTIFCSVVSRFPLLFDQLLEKYPDAVHRIEPLTFLILNFTSESSFYSAISHQSRLLLAQAMRNPTDKNLYDQIVCDASPYQENLDTYFNFNAPFKSNKLHIAVIDLIISDKSFTDILTYGLYSNGLQNDYLPFIRPEKLTMLLANLLNDHDPACRDLGFLTAILYCNGFSDFDKSLIRAYIIENPDFFDFIETTSEDVSEEGADQSIDKLFLQLKKIFNKTELAEILFSGSMNIYQNGSVFNQIFTRFFEETN
jgi:hypothetical protein